MGDNTQMRSEKRWVSYTGQKIHRYIFSEARNVWHIACRVPGWDKWEGNVVNPILPITCDSCRRNEDR